MMSVYRAVRRHWQWLWHRRGGEHDTPDLSAKKEERHVIDNHVAVRARFWDGVREGRREAEARCAKRNR